MKHGPLLALALAALALAAGWQVREQSARSPPARVTVVSAPITAQPRVEIATEIARAEAEGRYLRETAAIEAAYQTDQERCRGLDGRGRAACLEQARNDYSRKLADAQTRRGQHAAGGGRRHRPAPLLLAC